MRKLLFALLLCLLGSSAAHGQGVRPDRHPLNPLVEFAVRAHLFISPQVSMLIASQAASTSYTGLCDVSACSVFYGLRASSSATRGNKAVNVCLPSDTTCADLSTDPTTGKLVVTTIGGTSCSSVTCTVKTIYDQTAGNNCGGTCDATNATITTRPIFTPSCLGGLPCMTSPGTGSAFAQLTSTNASFVGTFPFTFATVAERTGGFTSYGDIFCVGITNPTMAFDNAANTTTLYNGVFLTQTAADSSPHAIQGLANSTTSKLSIDGSLASGNIGGSGTTSSIYFGECSNPLTGFFFEVALWQSDVSASISAFNSNQHTYYGF